MKQKIKEHDGCDKCKYLSKTEKQSPCKNCNANYLQPNGYADLWEKESKESLSEEANPVRPNHYKSCSIECIDAMILAFGADSVAEFCLINAFKYIWRYKDKNGITDIQKAEWYIGMSAELNGDMKKIESFTYMINKLREVIEDGMES